MKHKITDSLALSLLVHSLDSFEDGQGIWQFPLKILHPWNPPNRQTQIPRYLGTNLHWYFGLIRICTEKIELLDTADFGCVAFWVWSVTCVFYCAHMRVHCLSLVLSLSFTVSSSPTVSDLEREQERSTRISFEFFFPFDKYTHACVYVCVGVCVCVCV